MSKRIWAVVVVAMMLSGCGMFSRDVEEAPPLAPPPVTAVRQTAVVTRGSIAEKLEFSLAVRTTANRGSISR